MGGLLTSLSWDLGSGCLIDGSQNVSGSALELDRNISGWVIWVSMSPGACVL